MHWILSAVLGVGALLIIVVAAVGLLSYLGRTSRFILRTGRSVARNLNGPANPPRRMPPATTPPESGAE